jgi:hypothetical protein
MRKHLSGFLMLALSFAGVLLNSTNVFAQDSTDADGFRAYMYVARAKPDHVEWLSKGGRFSELQDYVKNCQSGKYVAPERDKSCDLIPVVTMHIATSLQEAYKGKVLDAINNMPPQLKEELRRAAIPEIEADIRSQIMSQITMSNEPVRRFGWQTAMLSAACGAIFGFLAAALFFYLKSPRRL